ncbi:MAG: hypothetical protein CMN30_15840 [Sandaracinus sp.]|nr:hypothetical protein [Sandaracinus sp.]
MSPEDRNRRYVRRAFDAEVEAAHVAGRGGRNTTLHRSGCRCFELSNAMPSELSRDEVRAALLEAAGAAGLPPREARATLRSAERRIGDSRARLPALHVDPGAAPIDFAALRRRIENMKATEHRDEAKRPPRGEVRYLWEHCKPVPLEVLAELSGKPRPNIDARRVGDLVRYLPDDVALPPWGDWWRRTGHRVVIPLRDHRGEIVTLHARAGRAAGNCPKQFGPRGYQVRGTAMANAIGVDLLRGDEFTRDYVAHAGVVITEGTPSWLAWATNWGGAFESEPACFAYYSGTWSKAHADAIPDGARVLLDPDYNEAGQRMARAVVETLGARVDLHVTKTREVA